MPIYIIMRKDGPYTSLCNYDGSPVQFTLKTWTVTAKCSLHADGHATSVTDSASTAIHAAIESVCAQVGAPIAEAWTSLTAISTGLL